MRHEKQRKKSYSTEEKKELLKQVETKSRQEAEKIFAGISPESMPHEKIRVLNATQCELRFIADEELLELIDQMKAKLQQKGSTDPSYADIIKYGLRKALKVDVHSKTTDEDRKEKPCESRVQATSPAEVEQNEVNLDKVKQSEVKNGTNSKTPQNKRTYLSVLKIKTAFNLAGSQCTFISPITGQRCAEKHFLQIEHIVPVAMGGSSEQENLTVLCASHNRLNAIHSYGIEKMRPYLKL